MERKQKEEENRFLLQVKYWWMIFLKKIFCLPFSFLKWSLSWFQNFIELLFAWSNITHFFVDCFKCVLFASETLYNLSLFFCYRNWPFFSIIEISRDCNCSLNQTSMVKATSSLLCFSHCSILHFIPVCPIVCSSTYVMAD